MEERLIDTKFGKVTAIIAGLAVAATVTLTAVTLVDIVNDPSIRGKVVTEQRGPNGSYSIIIQPTNRHVFSFETFFKPENEEERREIEELDRKISPGTSVAISGPGIYNPFYLFRVLPSYVRVE